MSRNVSATNAKPLALSQVFGLDKAKNPASYIVRKVEMDFLDALSDGAVNAIVIYGMSKQGKSSLLRHSLAERDHIWTDGNRGLVLEDLFHDVLCKAGFEYEESEVGGDFRLKWFWGEAGAHGAVARKPLQIKINNPASVAAALARYRQHPILVIDQFHTLDAKAQREFATAIATFAAHDIKVVVIGTWTDAGYLIRYNSNLIGALCEFSFEEWTTGDLHAVLNKGLPLLGLDTLPFPVRQSLVDRCTENVALLQELTKLCFTSFDRQGDVSLAASSLTKAGVETASAALLARVYKDVLQALRPISEIGESNPLAGGKSRSWWVLNAFLSEPTDDVLDGVGVDRLVASTNALASAAEGGAGLISKGELVSLLKQHWYTEQTKHGVTPILAYHDVKEALVIVDAWTRFVLRTRDTRQRLKAEL
jgi:hypothetical protein